MRFLIPATLSAVLALNGFAAAEPDVGRKADGAVHRFLAREASSGKLWLVCVEGGVADAWVVLAKAEYGFDPTDAKYLTDTGEVDLSGIPVNIVPLPLLAGGKVQRLLPPIGGGN